VHACAAEETKVTTTINTVTGPISCEQLGRTLVHEHVMVGYPGWESDTLRPGPSRSEALTIADDQVAAIRDLGVVSMIDPCPNDLGRDVELIAEVAQRSGFQIICATGLYKEDQGGGSYWKFRRDLGASSDSIAEMYIKELTEGIGNTGIKAGVIKVATGVPTITEYETSLLEAAAKASVETGAPILTHTDEGSLGDRQQSILTEAGVPAHRILIGHSCGTDDFDYHMGLVEGGSYLGFDRFGLEMLQPDEVRVASMLKLLEAGCASRLVVSHDSVWCWRGQPIPSPEAFASVLEVWKPTHFLTHIVPRLQDQGVTDEQISMMLDENPRRYFSGEPLEPISRASA